jgi:hypothetical protein
METALEHNTNTVNHKLSPILYCIDIWTDPPFKDAYQISTDKSFRINSELKHGRRPISWEVDSNRKNSFSWDTNYSD